MVTLECYHAIFAYFRDNGHPLENCKPAERPRRYCRLSPMEKYSGLSPVGSNIVSIAHPALRPIAGWAYWLRIRSRSSSARCSSACAMTSQRAVSMNIESARTSRTMSPRPSSLLSSSQLKSDTRRSCSPWLAAKGLQAAFEFACINGVGVLNQREEPVSNSGADSV